jgi:hypothetical protein
MINSDRVEEEDSVVFEAAVRSLEEFFVVVVSNVLKKKRKSADLRTLEFF